MAALKTALASDPRSAAAVVAQYLEKNARQLEMALPKHLDVQRLIRQARTQVSQSAKLGACDPRSIFAACVLAAQTGLELGVLGQGFLVPYRGRAQFVPGWMGMVDLVTRSGRATVWSNAVYDGDEFDFDQGSRPFVHHKTAGEDDPALLRYVYAVGQYIGAPFPVVEVWPSKKVWRHRDRFNKVGDAHYSFEHPEMYARKLPLLQVIKFMPKSVELRTAIAADYAAETGREVIIEGDGTIRDEEQIEPDSKSGGKETSEVTTEGTKDVETT